MRTAIRLAVFAAIVAAIALTLAPPIAGQALDVGLTGPLTPGPDIVKQLPATRSARPRAAGG